MVAIVHPARLDRIAGLVRLHELVDSGGIEPVSRANQAAAFARISRSSRNCLPKVTPQTGKFLAFGGRQSVMATTLVQIGLLEPILNGLCRRLELTGQLFRTAAGTNQLQYLPAIL